MHLRTLRILFQHNFEYCTNCPTIEAVDQDNDRDNNSDKDDDVKSEQEANNEGEGSPEDEENEEETKVVKSSEKEHKTRYCINCEDEVEDFMSEEDKYRLFKYSCYGCYKKIYKHDPKRYDRHLEKYKSKKEKEKARRE